MLKHSAFVVLCLLTCIMSPATCFLTTADTSVMNVVMVLVPSYMHMNTPVQCAISPTPKSSLLGNIHM